MHKLFGLLELDAAGLVLYSSLAAEDNLELPRTNLAGLNFYTEVAEFSNIEEFRRRVEMFNRSGEQAASFYFNCDYEEGSVAVRVILARIHERSPVKGTKSILVHIKKAD